MRNNNNNNSNNKALLINQNGVATFQIILMGWQCTNIYRFYAILQGPQQYKPLGFCEITAGFKQKTVSSTQYPQII